MLKLLRRQAGFAHVGLMLLTVFVVAVIVFVGYSVLNKNGSDPISSLVNKITGKSDSGNNQSNTWLKGCEGDDRKPMTHLPMNMEDVASFTPYGLTAGAHVTPIDHLYFYPKEGPRDKYPVYAMADGYIVEISSRAVKVDTGEARPPEYRIIFQHSCQTFSYYDLITKLDDSIAKEVADLSGNGNSKLVRIPVKSGQEIGRIGAQSLDSGIYNFSMTLPGFISPELYDYEFWKVHTDDFFSYFSEPLKNQMMALNKRMAEPRSGKIDYDQPGKLIGNWFKEGTEGYSGPKEMQGKPAENNRGYWSGHLAIFYHHIDPSVIIVSFGEFKSDGKPWAFAVKGNAPDPAKITKNDGVVTYELIQKPSESGPPIDSSNPQVLGVVLFHVLEGEKLKVEIFPDKTGAQVSGFSSSVQTYFR